MPDKPSCQECGREPPANAPQGLCPRCLAALALTLSPATEPPAPSAPATPPAAPGKLRYFGDYELLEEIARGGMGVVYRARQVSLNRVVAVKMLLFGKFSSDEFVKRFQTEAQAVASLQHPNIVAIHVVGEHEGQHYFSMDYVAGQNLAELVRNNPLPAKRAAGFIRTMAEAIHHAHLRGILHRDLKPSNVLIDEFDRPRITDFGLAKQLTGDSELTTTGQVLGSPNYMPPEQADAKRGAMGVYGDVYSLGAILYHLLTGRPPFLAETLEDTLRQLLNTEPAAPRLLNPNVPRDLETICLKCLHKDPRRRYVSAQALADDLRCFLDGKPVVARPASPPEKLWNWARRRPALAAVVVLLAVAAVGATLVAVHVNHLRGHERLLRYVASVNLAGRELQEGNRAQAVELLKQAVPKPGETELRGFEWRYLWRLCYGRNVGSLPAHHQVVGAMQYSPDGKLLATYCWDNILRVWDIQSRQMRVELPGASGLGVFSRDSAFLVAGSSLGSIYRYELATGQRICVATNAGEIVAYASDGGTLATLDSDGLLKVRDVETLQIKFQVPQPVARSLEFGPGSPVVLSLDGRLLAIVQSNAGLRRLGRGIRLWDLATGSELPPIAESVPIHCLQFSPDSNLLAVGNGDGRIKLWNLATREFRLIEAFAQPVQALTFSPYGSSLAAGSTMHLIKLWEVTTAQEQSKRFPGQLAQATALAFSPDGKTLACGSRDNPVWLWNTEQEEPPDAWEEVLAEEWGNIAFSPNGRLIAAGCKGDVVKVWGVDDGSLKAVLPRSRYVVAFDPGGKNLLTAGGDEAPQWWNVETGATSPVPPYSGSMASKVMAVAISPNRQVAALGHKDGRLQLLEIATGRELASWPGHVDEVRAMGFSPGGDLLVTGGRDHSVKLWDLSNPARPRLLGTHDEHRAAVCAVTFSREGRLIASGCGAGTIKFWDPTDLFRRPLPSISYHADGIRTLAFSPDGRTLASGSEDNAVRLWNVESRGEIASFPCVGPPRLVVFSPDGNTLATITDRGTLRLYRTVTLREADDDASAR